MSKKKIIIIVAVVLAVAVGGLYLYQSTQTMGTSVAGIPVSVESAKLDTLITTVTAKGEVSLINSELVYPAISAEVDEVLVEKNDIVKAGDPLIRYKETSREKIESQLREAELSLRSAQISLQDARLPATESELEAARLKISSAERNILDQKSAMEITDRNIAIKKLDIEDAQKELDKAQTLYDAGALTEAELDKAKKALKDAEDAILIYYDEKEQAERKLEALAEDLQQAQTSYTDIENRLGDQSTKNTIAQREIVVQQQQLKVNELRKDLAEFQEVVYSPIDGTVTSLTVSKGEITQTEKALLEISNIDEYVIKIDINERNAGKVQIGQDALIEGSVLGNTAVAGKVSKIGYIAEEKQTSSGTERVVPVEIMIDPSEAAGLLKPGFSLEATITTEVKENIIVVPILATLNDRDGNGYVYVVNDENMIEKKFVEIGAYADMTVEVTGLEEGEQIVSQPTLDMYEGMVIMPLVADEMLGEGGEPEGGELLEESAGGEEELDEGDGE